jgi:ribulose-5-phosphate 4-epimerase/fuculose-1-phosphate aldolase
MTSQDERDERRVRVDLSAAHRLAVADDLHEGTWNHFSAKVTGGLLLTPPATHWSMVSASGLVEIAAAERERLEREGGMLWTAYRIHAPIQAARPEVGCVLHCHPPHALALSLLEGGRLEPVEQNALYFQGRIAYADLYDGTSEFDLSHGEGMAELLGAEHTALLLKSHGVVVLGASVAEAYTDLYRLERACRAQVLALGTGRRLQAVPAEAVAKVAALNEDRPFKEAHFAAMKAVLDRREPDYAD